MQPLQHITCVTMDVSSKTADRSTDISAWRSVQGEMWKNIQTQHPSSPQPSIWDPALGLPAGNWLYSTEDDRNTVEKDRRGSCGVVAFQSGGRLSKLLGDLKST